MGDTTRRAALSGAMGAGLLLSLSEAAMAQAAETTQPVETNTGRVRGKRGRGVSSFLGIPYGVDTATCRFQPARAPAEWTGVRDCFAIGHQAPQMEPSMTGSGAGMDLTTPFMRTMLAATRQGMEVGNEGEDC